MNPITLTLIVAGMSSQHQVTSLAWNHPVGYVESGSLYVCTGTFPAGAFTYNGGAMTARIEADRCVGDVVFKGGFE